MKLRSIVTLSLAMVTTPLRPAIFSVTTTADSGVGSLRDAITSANGTLGSTIEFSGIGAGVHTITLESNLPTISASGTIIDGTTAPGWSTDTQGFAQPVIVIDGNEAFNGIHIVNASNCVIRGLVINNAGIGIFIDRSSLTTDSNAIYGCFLGTNQLGTAAVPNIAGIVVFGSLGSLTTNTIIGGALAGQGNLISGNTNVSNDGCGILVDAYDTGTVIRGNRIGTNKAGTAALPNNIGIGIAFDGINVTGTIIGGASSGQGNIISGNLDDGIFLQKAGSDATIQGNFIGTDTTGTIALGNGGFGINESENIVTVVVGGGSSGQGNVIASNSLGGIRLSGAGGNTVQGNVIGGADLGNGGPGITLVSDSNFIGSNALSTLNTIVNNTGAGISVLGTATLNPILINSIYNNRSHGINLVAGGNNNQTPPALLSATAAFNVDNTITVVAKTPTVPGSSLFRLEFFINDDNRNPDITEGQTFIGETHAVPSGTTVTQIFSVPSPTVVGKYLSATATVKNNQDDTPSDTSPFSSNVLITSSTFSAAAALSLPTIVEQAHSAMKAILAKYY